MIKALEKCTLSQACEWIAYDRLPLDEEDEEDLCYEESRAQDDKKELREAAGKLRMALRHGDIKAFGFYMPTLEIREIPTEGDKTTQLFPWGDYRKEEIADTIELASLDGEKTETYLDVWIDFEELRLLFSKEGGERPVVQAIPKKAKAKQNMFRRGRKPRLSPDQMARLKVYVLEYIKKQVAGTKKKSIVHDLIGWATKEFELKKKIGYTTMRDYICSFLDSQKMENP